MYTTDDFLDMTKESKVDMSLPWCLKFDLSKLPSTEKILKAMEVKVACDVRGWVSWLCFRDPWKEALAVSGQRGAGFEEKLLGGAWRRGGDRRGHPS